MLRVSAYDEAALAEVEGGIHDWFFDLADVRYDRAARQVLIPFRRWSYEQARRLPPSRRGLLWSALGRLSPKWEAPWHRWFLRMERVTDFTIRDEAQIGTADFNTISYDSRKQSLTIECSIPVTMRFKVEGLAVHLEETDEVLGRARYRAWRNSPFATSYTGEVLPLRDRGPG